MNKTVQDKMVIEDVIQSGKEEEIKQKNLEFAEKHKETFNDLKDFDDYKQELALITLRKLSEAGSSAIITPSLKLLL